ncbi:MAG: hypothetical protein Q9160_003665 [Pyrenula sp. 1 TL-2023]
MPCLSTLLVLFIFSPSTFTLGAFLNKRHVSGRANIAASYENKQCTIYPHTYDSKHPSPVYVCPDPAIFTDGPPLKPIVMGSKVAGVDSTKVEHVQHQVSTKSTINHVKRGNAPVPTMDPHYINAKRDTSSSPPDPLPPPTPLPPDPKYINAKRDAPSPPTVPDPDPHYINAKRDTPSPPPIPDPYYINAKRDTPSPPTVPDPDPHYINAKRDTLSPPPVPDPHYINAKRDESALSAPPPDSHYINAKRGCARGFVA